MFRNDDHSAMLDKAHHARLRIEELERRCAAGEAQIRVAQSRYDSIPAYDRGWMLEVIALLAIVSVVLEWFPARMMSLVFFFATAVELVALTCAFAVGGFLLGLLLGELLRRHRKPQPHAVLDWIFLLFAGIAVAAFLAVGYALRFGYATASTDGSASAVNPTVQALALTTLAFIGIVIAFTSGYYRESVEALRVRWRLNRLRGALRADEAHLEATRQELSASERAFRFADDDEGRIAEARAAAAASSVSYDGPAGSDASASARNGAVH
ncbi:MAG TPA: hypothetical protein VGX96_03245 [Candidatus Elarobacter sp.]|nr:hypothetical protein [Candidatus Elarobacter sp.]